MSGYITYHLHSDCSLLDSCSKFEEYVDLAVANGQKAIASTEHGKPLNWVSKKLYCDSKGIKFIHGVEIYLTASLNEKVRDNYHTILLAKNMAGILELNNLVSLSCDKDHFYYTNRISFDEFLGISDNIISTSACLASPLRELSEDNPYYMLLANKYDYLEIQPHLCDEQVEYNKKIYELSQILHKPLIAGTDTHSSSKYKAECREVLLSAKHKKYADDGLNLTYMTYDELVDAFRTQSALPDAVYMQAIENTNTMADSIEDFVLDKSIKYPILYGTHEADDEKFTETINKKFADKLERGVIPYDQKEGFEKAIEEEMRVLRKLNMTGFMLSMSELVSWCKETGKAIGPARGSVGGSRVAYISDIIDLNPEQWHTNFARFCNEDRVEVGDIDTDVVDTDRPEIFAYIVGRFGTDKTSRVASFGTIQEKGVIDDVGRHLAQQWSDAHPDITDIDKNPWSLRYIDKIKKEYDASPEKTKTKYPEMFYYMDGLLGTKVSQSVHPAGMVISPITLADNYGMFDKDGDNCLFLDMDEAHEVGLVKYDFLILKSVKVIRDACDYIGIPYPKSHEVDFDDQEVWEDISKNADMIFQFESSFGADSIKKFKPKSIFDMSLVTAGMRPSGASYRENLFRHETHKNPSELIDNLLKDNNGFLVYQEDIIRFLQEVCGLSGSTADSVRRGIAKKKMEILEQYMPQIVEGYCSKSDKPREIAEEEIKEYLKIIEDASAYMFGYNHSVAYCILGYYYGYFRHYYPLEFLTSYLNNAANDDDIKTGTAYASKIGIRVTMPKFGLSKGEYFFDKEQNIIAKGVSSIKYMSPQLANELYEVAHSKKYLRFTDLLSDLNKNTSINTRQLDILIKLDFFSDFGNQRELLRICDMFYNTFKKGEAKQIKKELVDGTPLEPIVSKYAIGVTKSGAISKNYTLLDTMSILRETEDAIKSVHMEDLSDIVKVQNFYDAMGYIGYTSNKEEDRKKLYIMDVFPLRRKKDNKQFGYSLITRSIGSGKESRFTVYNAVYNKDPIVKGNIIYCKSFERDGKFFELTGYDRVM